MGQTQRTRPYTANVDDLVVEESAGVPVEELTVEDDAGVLNALSKAKTIGPPTSLASQVIRQLPTAGAIAGGFMGGGRTNPLGMVTTALGSAAGITARDLANIARNRLDLVEPTASGRATEMAETAGLHAGGEAIGRGVAAPLFKTAEWMMGTGLKTGLRVPSTARPGTVITAKNTPAAAFETVNIPREFLSRSRAVRASGLQKTEAQMIKAREAAMQRVRQAEAELGTEVPESARLLPEGRVRVGLGEPPVPSGGRPALQQAEATERVPFNARRDTQGMSADPSITQMHGGMPARGAPDATVDLVEGPGSVWLPADAVGVSNVSSRARLPGSSVGDAPSRMRVTVDEALAPVLKWRKSLVDDMADPGHIRLVDRMIARYRDAYSAPVRLTVAQERKDAQAEIGERIWRSESTATSPLRAMFSKLLSDGYRKAIEDRIPDVAGRPGIRALNQATQREIAMFETLRSALNRERLSERNTISGLIASPQLWGAAAHGTRRAGSAARWTPQAARGASMAITDEDE